MWELINGMFVNKETGDRLTPEEYKTLAEEQSAAPEAPTNTDNKSHASGPVLGQALGFVGKAVGSYVGGPVGGSIGGRLGSVIGSGKSIGEATKLDAGAQKQLVGSALTSYLTSGADSGTDSLYTSKPELSDVAQKYAADTTTGTAGSTYPIANDLSMGMGTNPVYAQSAQSAVPESPSVMGNINALLNMGRGQAAGYSGGLIGGDYIPSEQSPSSVANLSEGFTSGGKLDSMLANLKEGNIASAIGGAARYGYSNYKPQRVRRRYY